MSDYISRSVIKRLPRYYRFLGDLLEEGMIRISSKELSEKMKLTASQIRQDLNCFGGFGQQGYGYNIKQLHSEIGKILGVDNQKKAILVGVGNLGTAIATHIRFEQRGFKLIGVFDQKAAMSGTIIHGMPVRSTEKLEEFCADQKPVMAILCVPKEAAKDIAEELIKLGVKSFWNFSHYDLGVEFGDVTVENVHLGDSLMRLGYHLTQNNNKNN